MSGLIKVASLQGVFGGFLVCCGSVWGVWRLGCVSRACFGGGGGGAFRRLGYGTVQNETNRGEVEEILQPCEISLPFQVQGSHTLGGTSYKLSLHGRWAMEILTSSMHPAAPKPAQPPKPGVSQRAGTLGLSATAAGPRGDCPALPWPSPAPPALAPNATRSIRWRGMCKSRHMSKLLVQTKLKPEDPSNRRFLYKHAHVVRFRFLCGRGKLPDGRHGLLKLRAYTKETPSC